MSFRRKKEDVSAQREWKEFIHQNAGLIAEIGIPETICRSHDNFVYFRMHGNHPDDMSYFHSWALSPVQVERLMKRQIGRRAGALMVSRHVELADAFGIAEASIGDDARASAHRQPGNQDRAGRGRARILAAIHHQHPVRGAGFHGHPLRMIGIAEGLDGIAILARGDVSQREGLTDHHLALPVDRADALDELVAQSALEQGRRNRRCGDLLQFRAGLVGKGIIAHLASHGFGDRTRPVSRWPVPRPAARTPFAGNRSRSPCRPARYAL